MRSAEGEGGGAARSAGLATARGARAAPVLLAGRRDGAALRGEGEAGGCEVRPNGWEAEREWHVAYAMAVRGYEQAYQALRASPVGSFTDIIAYSIIVAVLSLGIRIVLVVVFGLLYLMCPFRCRKCRKCRKCPFRCFGCPFRCCKCNKECEECKCCKCCKCNQCNKECEECKC